ncbi:MAG: autoinducer 2 ABC transporter substrate-binding protein [Chthonomonadales bacterium]
MKRSIGNIFMLAGVVAIAALSGCGDKPDAGSPSSPTKDTGTSTTGGKSKRIVFVFKSAGQYSEVCKTGAMRANDELKAQGVTVDYFAPEKAENAKQVQYIEQMIAAKADAIIISPNDAQAIVPVLKKATDAGVKVYTWDSDAPTSARRFYVAASEDVKIGVDIAESLAKDLGGKGKVAIMSGGRGAANLNLHVQGVEEGLKKFPGITVIKPYIYNDEDQNKAVDMAKAAFQKDPDIAGFAGVNSQAPPGIGEAVKQLGKTGKVKVWGLALPSATKDYLHHGDVSGVMLWDPAALTYLTAILVNDDLGGKAPQDGKEYPGIGKISVKGPAVVMPGMTFTKDNVDKFNF